MDVLAAEMVASLFSLRGSTDERGVARPTEDDVGAALLRATDGWVPVASETEILDSAIPAIKGLVDESSPATPCPLLGAMDVAIRALSRLRGISTVDRL